jgi:Sulfotransferase family
VFLWVPKTAGTSLWGLLKVHGGGRYLSVRRARWEFPNRGLATFGHMYYPSLIAQGVVSGPCDARAFKFTIVRNPFDRVVSLYHHLQQRGLLPAEMRFEELTERLREECLRTRGRLQRPRLE